MYGETEFDISIDTEEIADSLGLPVMLCSTKAVIARVEEAVDQAETDLRRVVEEAVTDAMLEYQHIYDAAALIAAEFDGLDSVELEMLRLLLDQEHGIIVA